MHDYELKGDVMPFAPRAVFVFDHEHLEDDEIGVVFPSVNKTFREEMTLLGGRARPKDQPSRDEAWVFDAARLQKICEAIEDLYPQWVLDPQCAHCGTVNASVAHRSDRDWLQLCGGCYAPAGRHH